MCARKIVHTDVAIAGGGCGGATAAIQAARMGISVVLVEETPWLGGMLTSAGVVAFDGNWGTLMCGFYRELVREIEIHYGGAAKTEPGWVTRTAFEPHVLAQIFLRKVQREDMITVFFESQATELLREGNKVTGFRFRGKDGDYEVHAKIIIDATEYGELIHAGGIEYRFGRESKDQTGEPDAPGKPDNEIQDITYVAILKDFMAAEGKNAPEAPETADYDPSIFKSSTAVDADEPSNHNHKLHTWETFIDYGKLPHGKYMINWPFHANDFPDALACFDRGTREDAYRRAKAHTLNFIHYMQTVLGHPELGIADDEFPTADGLPFIPYVRETRRIVGDYVMREQDVLPVNGKGTRPPLQKDAIAAGDYFLDHHHARAHPGHPDYFEEKYPSNAKFQVPAGVFFPRGIDGFMAAEKSISVTHIVNGCTRLQPIVLLMGQAAGVIAAMAVKSGCEPRRVPIREVQEFLILHEVMLYPYDDMPVTDRVFVEAQKLALAGVVFDDEDFQFRRNESLSWDEVSELLAKANGGVLLEKSSSIAAYRAHIRQLMRAVHEQEPESADAWNKRPTRASIAPILCAILAIDPVNEVKIRFLDMPHTHWAARFIEPIYRMNVYEGIWQVNFKPDEPLTRAELTLIIDRVFDPFNKLPVINKGAVQNANRSAS